MTTAMTVYDMRRNSDGVGRLDKELHEAADAKDVSAIDTKIKDTKLVIELIIVDLRDNSTMYQYQDKSQFILLLTKYKLLLVVLYKTKEVLEKGKMQEIPETQKAA